MFELSEGDEGFPFGDSLRPQVLFDIPSACLNLDVTCLISFLELLARIEKNLPFFKISPFYTEKSGLPSVFLVTSWNLGNPMEGNRDFC
jgi:hypothetical protein